MVDKVDEANQTADYLVDVMIGNAKRNESVAKETGYCLNCGEPISEQGRRWCNADCRDDWQHEFKKHGMSV